MRITTNPASVTSGNNCTLLTSTIVRCSGITRMEVLGLSRDDEIRNNTAIPNTRIPMGSNGGSGNDILVGGSKNDTTQRWFRLRHR